GLVTIEIKSEVSEYITHSSRLKYCISITLSLLRTNILSTLAFYIISTINFSLLLVKAMTGSGPNGSTEVFLSYMFAQAYGNSTYGYGMAIGVVVFLFSFILAAVVSKITKREVLAY